MVMVSALVMVPSWGQNTLHNSCLNNGNGKVAHWRYLSLLERLYAGVDSTSFQAERNLSILDRTVDNRRSVVAVRKVEQFMLLRLNKIPFVMQKVKSTPVP